MTRKNSSCKTRTLVWKCCGRNAALFTLSLLLQLVAMPVGMILRIQEQLQYVDLSDPEQRDSVWTLIHGLLYEGQLGMFVLAGLAVLCGIAMFRYLHVKQQTDFFHALPVTRGQLFASHVITGVLAVVPAYLLSVVLTCGVCVAYDFADVVQIDILLLSMAVHLAGFLLVYAVSILAAICCGNTLVSLLVCGWFQFGLLAGCEAVDALVYVLYPARVYGNAGMPVWLSPFFGAMSAINPLTDVWPDKPVRYFEACMPRLLLSLFAAAVILALAYWLNQIRRSENTGLSLAFPKLEQPLKLYIVSTMAISCGIIIQSTITSWTVMFFSMAVAALITACVVEIVYHQDFGSLFYRWKSLLVYFVICAVVLGCMANDITGWNSKLPERDTIVSASLSSDLEEWDCMPNEAVTEDDTVYFGRDTMYYLLSSLYYDLSGAEEESKKDYIDYWDGSRLESKEVLDAMYASASMGAEAMKGDRSTLQTDSEQWSYTVIFTLKNGKTFQRQYYMPGDSEELAKYGAAVRFSEEYQEKYTPAAFARANRDQVSEMLVMNYGDVAQYSADEIKNPRTISDILDTLYEESQELTQDYCAEHMPVLALRVVGQEETWTPSDLTDMDMRGRDMDDIIDIPVYACETDTLELLKENLTNFHTGFVSEDITQMEITTYTEDYDEKTVTLRATEPTEANTMQKWLPYVIPQQFDALIDPVYYRKGANGENVTAYVAVRLKDGAEANCYCYRDVDGKD